MKQRLNIYTPLVLLMIITLVAPLTIASIDTGVDFSYSFENFPSSTVTDDSGNNNDATVTDPFNMATANSKIGNWALITNNDAQYIETDSTRPSTVSQWAFSFWVYIPNPLISIDHTLFSDSYSNEFSGVLNSRGYHVRITQDNEIQTIHARGSSSGGAGCGLSDSRRTITDGANFEYDEWNHITLSYDSGETTITLNGQTQNVTHTGTGGFTTAVGYDSRIGNTRTTCMQSTNTTKIFDQFIRYNRTLDSNEINVLYNAGIGVDPFDIAPPTQIANIPPVNLAFNGFLQYNLNDFFTGALSYDITFNYSLASYNVSSGDSVNTGDFAIQLQNNLVNFWGLNNEVQPVTLNINAHKGGGTTTTTTTLRVGFGASNIPFQIASVAPITLTPTTSTTRRFSDFFIDYTNTYIEYVDPDTQQTVTVSAGFPNSNSCISTSINGDILTVTAKNITCSINARLVVDDGSTGVYSNEFRISVTQSATETGVDWLNTVFNLLPPADTIGFAARMFYVAIVMIFTAMAGAFIIFSTPNINGTLISAGIGVLLLSEFLFFTAIGYIPIWIVITLGSLAAVIGISIFRTNTMGH